MHLIFPVILLGIIVGGVIYHLRNRSNTLTMSKLDAAVKAEAKRLKKLIP